MSRTVRVLVTTGNKTLQTVNVSLTDSPAFEKVIATDTDDRAFETVQNSGGAIAGLKTLYVTNPDVVESNLLLMSGGNLVLQDGTVLLLMSN